MELEVVKIFRRNLELLLCLVNERQQKHTGFRAFSASFGIH